MFLFDKFRRSISTRWAIFFTIELITIPTILIISSFYYREESQTILKAASEQLLSIQKSKIDLLQEFEKNNSMLVVNLANNPTAVNAMVDFGESMDLLQYNFVEQSKKSNSGLVELGKNYLNRQVISEIEPLGSPLTAAQLLPPDETGLVIQNLYIYENKDTKKRDLDDAGDDSLYTFFHKKYNPWFRSYIDRNQFYDLFLVNDKTGEVLYTVQKEVDFGNNLKKGALKDHGIGKLFEKASRAKPGEVFYSDFDFYPPSGNEPAAFVATPLFEDTRRIGVLILQISSDALNKTLTTNYRWKQYGLGDTGESLLIGLDGRVRNDTRLSISDPEAYRKFIEQSNPEPSTLRQIEKFKGNALIQASKTEGFNHAQKNNPNISVYKNYLGKEVLGAYDLIQFQQQNYALTSEIEEAESFAPLIVFRAIAIATTIIISILIGLLSFQLSSFVVKPLELLSKSVVNFSKGDYSIQFKSSGHVQEIQELSNAFKAMAEAVSADIQYRENTQKLIEASAKELQEANQHIEDSIKVSSGIQKSHLPTQSDLDELFNHSYYLWQPKDIVGGDFFWVAKYGTRTYALCGDCTGHGVPGAFMTLLAYSALTQISEEVYRTAPLDFIIQELHHRFSKSLGLHKQDAVINTGFEASMLCFDAEHQTVSFVGAGQHLIIKNATDQSVQFIKGNKHPIGYKTADAAIIPAAVHSFELKDQLFVLYSDGWTTQVGQQARRMMGNNTLLKAIENSGQNTPQQLGRYLESFFKDWTGTEARRDDLSLIVLQGLSSSNVAKPLDQTA